MKKHFVIQESRKTTQGIAIPMRTVALVRATTMFEALSVARANYIRLGATIVDTSEVFCFIILRQGNQVKVTADEIETWNLSQL